MYIITSRPNNNRVKFWLSLLKPLCYLIYGKEEWQTAYFTVIFYTLVFTDKVESKYKTFKWMAKM